MQYGISILLALICMEKPQSAIVTHVPETQYLYVFICISAKMLL